MSYKWTVLFLVHASNKDTQVHAKALFKMIESTNYNEEIKVLVLYGLQSVKIGGYKTEVTLREIVKKEPTGLTGLREINPGFGTIDFGDDKQLSKIFADIRTKFPSDRFLLLTWDHGSGFGIFKLDPRERGLHDAEVILNLEDLFIEENSRSIFPEEESIQFSVIRNESTDEGSGSRGIKEPKTSMLSNDELRNMIKYNADAKKVDVLIMMNCLMQMIETGYALNDTVDYLVAPETCIFWAGYDYMSIINKLCSDPEIETEAIARYAIDTIKAYYEKTRFKKYLSDLVVSLVMPARSIGVKIAIDETAEYLNDKLADEFNNIKAIRQKCEDLSKKYVEESSYHYVDFLHCIADLTPTSDMIHLDKVKSAMQDYVIHIIKGSNYSKVNEDNNIGQVNGFTIYYPSSALEADKDIYYGWFYKVGNHQTLFAADCAWKSFLINYLKTDRQS